MASGYNGARSRSKPARWRGFVAEKRRFGWLSWFWNCPSHPQVAIAHNELGTLLLERGLPDRAEEAHRRALSIQRTALPAGHPHLAWSLIGQGLALQALGELDAAHRAVVEAVSIRRTSLPAENPLRQEAERVLAGIDAERRQGDGRLEPD